MQNSKPLIISFVFASLLFNIYLFSTSFASSLTGSVSVIVLHSLSFETFLGTVLFYDVVIYFFTVMLLHFALGVILFLLYRPVEKRWFREQRIHYLGAALFFIAAIIWITQLNSTLFPNSNHAYEVLKLDSAFAIALWLSISMMFLVLVVINLSYCYKHIVRLVSTIKNTDQYKTIAIVGLVGILSIAFYINSNASIAVTGTTSNVTHQPNIVIIGIDSLRADHTNNKHTAKIPHLRKFLEQATVFNNATSPLARTFPAWLSILTGKNPLKTGARANLISPDKINFKGNLANLLKQRGYSSIYAIDDRRFNNIDDEYGFDRIVGPNIGMADFILGSINDMPLNNLISMLPIANYLFPFTYNNRAANVTYNPKYFKNEIMSAIDEQNTVPLFLNIHLCLIHWPYTLANELPSGTDHDNYLRTLSGVDKQFGEIMSALKQKNILDNALIFVISDHGEAFQLETDTVYHHAINNQKHKSLFLDPDNGNIIPASTWHGTSILGTSQNAILFSFRDYRNNTLPVQTIDTPVSLIDITPTILDSLNISYIKSDYEGKSLLNLLNNKAGFSERFFFLETGFTFKSLINPDGFNLQETIKEGIGYYDINNNGRLTLKDEALGKLIKFKQRAVLFKDWSLAFISPSLPPVLINQEQNTFWHQHEFSSTDAPTGEMLTALCDYYNADSEFSSVACSNQPAAKQN